MWYHWPTPPAASLPVQLFSLINPSTVQIFPLVTALTVGIPLLPFLTGGFPLLSVNWEVGSGASRELPDHGMCGFALAIFMVMLGLRFKIFPLVTFSTKCFAYRGSGLRPPSDFALNVLKSSLINDAQSLAASTLPSRLPASVPIAHQMHALPQRCAFDTILKAMRGSALLIPAGTGQVNTGDRFNEASFSMISLHFAIKVIQRYLR
ncbi:hypothetical protein BDK51DRAFT_40790 [Blyttiomyces helicus]|uniref:Uncharacterized protein n=1 Tax=Blyttiomyces helicus TaxID=388810 RepID=A0A4V1IRE7_9FUNG|nr:hypothetical protein BDK51DRAFT_40790 [Blyttiomyces helicus]|eukprot:RKO89797.1 hypothetical protein BDK51DRAFT_40790 [Blyttiomyces helicus]